MEEEDYRCDSEVEADSDHEDHEETLEHHGGWLGNNLVHFHMVSVSRLLGVITPFHTMSLPFHLLSAEVLCLLCHSVHVAALGTFLIIIFKLCKPASTQWEKS